MMMFLVIGYLRRPWRIIRTLKALVTERSHTVVEQRLVEIKRRVVSALRRDPVRRDGRAGYGELAEGCGPSRVRDDAGSGRPSALVGADRVSAAALFALTPQGSRGGRLPGEHAPDP